jgi:hypothetical protein
VGSSLGLRACVIFVIATALAVAVAAEGQPPQPIATSTDMSGHEWYISPLDTQGCGPAGDPSCQVFNRTASALGDKCAWNDQDSILRAGGGYVEGTFTDRLCIVADYDGSYGPANELYPKGIYVNVSAPADTLAVSLDNDAGAHWDAGASVPDGNRRLWRVCVTDTVADGRPLSEWPEVPDSNGGRGQLVEYMLSVASLTSRTRDVYSRFEVATRYHNPPVSGERHTITNCP